MNYYWMAYLIMGLRVYIFAVLQLLLILLIQNVFWENIAVVKLV